MAQRKRNIRMPSNDEFMRMYGSKSGEKMDDHVTPPNSRTESGPGIIWDFGFDVSGSMTDFYDELPDCFNTIMIPSLVGAAKRYKSVMRIGGFLFSDDIIPMWDKFRSLDELGKAPFRRETIDQPGLRSMTALYRAMISGLNYTAKAVSFMNQRNTSRATGKLIILTDGANNLEPENPEEVRRITSKIKNNGEFQTVLAFFNTGKNGLTKSEFEMMAKKTGFSETYYFDVTEGKSLEIRRKDFRHAFNVFSDNQFKR